MATAGGNRCDRPRSPPPGDVPATLVTVFSYRYIVAGLGGLHER